MLAIPASLFIAAQLWRRLFYNIKSFNDHHQREFKNKHGPHKNDMAL